MRKSYKIIFLGNTSVGKTLLIYRYVSDGMPHSEPTIGIDFFSSTLEVESQSVRLQLWDTAGQERYKSIITPYIRDSFLAVIVYAIDDRESFNKLKYWIDLYMDKNNNKHSKILIVANKRDLKISHRVGINDNTEINGDSGDKFAEQFVTDAEGIEFAAKYGAQFCTASALKSSDIDDLSAEIKNAVVTDLENNPELEDDVQGINSLNARQNNKWCC